jgi:hypothetical protein
MRAESCNETNYENYSILFDIILAHDFHKTMITFCVIVRAAVLRRRNMILHGRPLSRLQSTVAKLI